MTDHPRFYKLSTSDPVVLDDCISPADLRAAMQDWSDRHDDFLAEYCTMMLRAELYDQRIEALQGLRGMARFFAELRALLWRWNRAALCAQAHQVFCHVVAQRQHRLNDGTYDPACFEPDPRLEAMAMQRLIQRLNVANGHGMLYQRQ